MAVEITVPALGESIVEATVGRWLKQPGEPVEEGETLVELETDKVNMEVPASQSGVLARILKPQGSTVGVGDVLAEIGAGDGAKSAPTQPAAQSAAAQPAPASVQASTPAAPTEASPRPPRSSADSAFPVSPPAVTANGAGAGTTLISPVALRIAQEHGLAVGAIPGTGLNGRVTKDDVVAYLRANPQPAEAAAQPQPETPPPPTAVSSPLAAWGEGSGVRAIPTPIAPPAATDLQPAPAVPIAAPGLANGRREERVRLSRRRQTIARRLVEAQHTAAMLTTFNEVDMSAVLELRARRRDAFKERHGVGLGFMSFFTKAVIGGLKAYPRLNAEIQGDEMILKYYYDIGIAVSTDEGLVVPVLRDADRLSFAEIERGIAELAKKARERRLSLEDLQGGTFTITNGGVFGSLLSTPILNAPQVGILGMHKIEQRPIALDGKVVIHPMMYLAVSYDHRIVDGAESVSFLVRVKELLEDPEKLLLEG
ncbi:MAG TPA: 2-oxoglutarate dehydrogenase complex dihydrolipoyllysine-residue succinyltransferase [Ktedonobacterales bacterium]|nr:2-oxoglutarate dehydrogenase complex dihydrolipoyllysine-residue succinyltransferase [Ktedonobacterales bacterium]